MPPLPEYTVPGLHDYLFHTVLPELKISPGLALDLGAGSGALGLRLRERGFNVLGVDQRTPPSPPIPWVELDLNTPGFDHTLGKNEYDLITAVEVIEHLENPYAFLRGIRSLLKPSGIALLTTPNLGNLPSRIQFLLKGTLRYFDARGEPTHISPLFTPILLEKILPSVGLRRVHWWVYPPRGFLAARPILRPIYRTLAAALGGGILLGDTLIVALAPNENPLT